jgi:hypothetical protein
VRGEDQRMGSLISSRIETPPRARGRLPATAALKARSRNTPACAGKTNGGCNQSPAEQKHPRVRGEDPMALPRVMLLQETPPRARGRRRSWLWSLRWKGNTPACAGKTPKYSVVLLWTTPYIVVIPSLFFQRSVATLQE